MRLGPFGEIVDPEDTFLKTAEIPSLDAIVAGNAPSVWDVRAPLLQDPDETQDPEQSEEAEDSDEEEATQLDLAPLNEDLPDASADGLTADLEPVSELGLDTLDPPDDEPGPHEIAPRDPARAITVEAPAPLIPDEPEEPVAVEVAEEPTIPAGLPPEEPTIPAGLPPEEPTIPAGRPAVTPGLAAERTGAIPPIYDEEGIPDDVSLHGDAFAPLELALGDDEDENDDDTLELPTVFPEPTGEEPPPVTEDFEED
jgi:hypothetical protein